MWAGLSRTGREGDSSLDHILTTVLNLHQHVTGTKGPDLGLVRALREALNIPFSLLEALNQHDTKTIPVHIAEGARLVCSK